MTIEEIPQEAFTSGLLDREVHDRLLSDIDQITTKAGVPRSAVWTGLSKACTPSEAEWVRTLRAPSDSGLIFVGSFEIDVERKMQAIAGVCLRNYTDARMMSVQDVLRALKSDSMPPCTVLLVPNFCLAKDDGGDIPTWEVTNLMGLLIFRSGRGLKTILSCPSLSIVEKQYGASFRKHLQSRYAIATPDGVQAIE